MTDDTSPVFAYHSRPSMIDFPGRLAAIFFTAGCSFRCGFCHNAELLGRRKTGLRWSRLESACVHFHKNWVDGVVISGGEPTCFEGELIRLIRFFRQYGFAIKLDTNGSRPDVLEEVLPLVDYVAMDIKCALGRYAEFVGFADADKIARSIELLKTATVAGEFRTTVVEGLHGEEEIAEIGALLAGAKQYVLQPFLPRQDLPDPEFRTRPRTSPAFLKKLVANLAKFDLTVQVRGA